MSDRIVAFTNSLKRTPKGLFNPWFHRDPHNDISHEAPAIRKRQLEAYLSQREHRARFLFIAEALGYQGGHFTGMAMTSERILMGHQEQKYGVRADHVFRGIRHERTSRPEINPKGMSEPTATIMWGALIELGLDPYDVVLWNAVPWHPYNPARGLLSNRTPSANEMKAGLRHLKSFLQLFPDSRVIAVGKKCEESLTGIGVPHICVRHPANGGAPKFRSQVQELI